jgi:uncharacterized protein DUF2513
MKRDMDLLRNLLLEIEKPPQGSWADIPIEGHTPEEVCYRAKLACDAGFIEGKFVPSTLYFVVSGLTYAGHEFPDAARQDTLWAKAKETVQSATGTLTIDWHSLRWYNSETECVTGLGSLPGLPLPRIQNTPSSIRYERLSAAGWYPSISRNVIGRSGWKSKPKQLRNDVQLIFVQQMRRNTGKFGIVWYCLAFRISYLHDSTSRAGVP